jgi:hypothetical protein
MHPIPASVRAADQIGVAQATLALHNLRLLLVRRRSRNRVGVVSVDDSGRALVDVGRRCMSAATDGLYRMWHANLVAAGTP